MITSCPSFRSTGASKSHVPLDCHAPCTRTKVDMAEEFIRLAGNCAGFRLCFIPKSVPPLSARRVLFARHETRASQRGETSCQQAHRYNATDFHECGATLSLFFPSLC